MVVRFNVITIFPDYFSPLNISLLGKAQGSGLITVRTVNLRNFASAPHFSVDDTPYGGGAGMVMRADILADAVDSVLVPGSKLVFLTPSGQKFTQQVAEAFATTTPQVADSDITLVCGRFEGFDVRVQEYYELQDDVEVLGISIGDYVLCGGEVAALVIIEAVVRLVPGVLGNPQSLAEESYQLDSNGQELLEYPNYTRPANFRDLEVPSVLLSGNHEKIREWRHEQAVKKTNDALLNRF
ncbi:MAG: tRNA (guanosine(37)-N1)-methyltransferase TrmD [Candidatus Ancillula trichonymphae]|jgi:tRNA (guanine37-N1)-methyltransferase|nr:tRNA (guanosine(37)-N1)-methyltransferase TrmD [Candidatus Ancillula trichonymphae]